MEEWDNYSPQNKVLWLSKPVDNPLTKTVGVKSKYWNPGDTIRIKFLNVEPALQQKIKNYAALWLSYANLYFKYVNPDEYADVKIGTSTDDRWIAWSTLGIDCKLVSQDQPSLSFCWFDPSESEVKINVLRGFGHVLGLDFEHKHPASNIVLKSVDLIIGDYNLSEQEAEEFKRIYLSPEVDVTQYGKNSVMMIPISRRLVVNPSTVIGSDNQELSANDEELIAKIYPKPVIIFKLKGTYAEIAVGSTYWEPTTELDPIREVDWGDGTKEKLPRDAYYTHVYRKDSVWTVRLYGNSTTYKMFVSIRGVCELDVTESKSLETLYCDYGSLQRIDLSKNPNLRLLSLLDNNLTVLDISQNPLLEQISCDNNAISVLSVGHCSRLQLLYCANNEITDLEVSKSILLNNLCCFGNRLDMLKIANRLLPRPQDDHNGMFVVKDAAEKGLVQRICGAKNWDVFVHRGRSVYSLGQGMGRAQPFRDKVLR